MLKILPVSEQASKQASKKITTWKLGGGLDGFHLDHFFDFECFEIGFDNT